VELSHRPFQTVYQHRYANYIKCDKDTVTRESDDSIQLSVFEQNYLLALCVEPSVLIESVAEPG
jgi:hypothetical protein